jgi:cysteine desulfurase/selenocysteine lyase
MDHFHIPATARASLALYNSQDDIDALVRGLMRAEEMFEACPISKTFTKK